MKNRIPAIIVTLVALCFTSFLYHGQNLKLMQADNISINDSQKPEYETEDKTEAKALKENESSHAKPSSPAGIKLYALSAALIDADNGRVLYEKKGNTEMAMASTTKIMTCIVTLENAKLDDVVTVSSYASKMPDVQLNIRAGEQYILRDLLYSLMLESHNDVAVAIAEHVGGSVEGFAAMMNAKAKELGCEHTNFVTPNGLDAENHHTTAVELARIAGYAIRNKQFIDITNTASWQFTDLKKNRSFSVSNKDRFLYLYDGAIGVKTGFTNRAGYCFVGAASRNKKTFVAVVLGSGWPPNKNYKWRDTTALMNYGMDNYELTQIFNPDKKFDPVPVDDGQENFVDLYYKGDISLLMRKDEAVKVVYKVPRMIKAPVKADSPVGIAGYYVGDDLIEEVPIMTCADVDRINLNFCIKRIFNLWQMK